MTATPQTMAERIVKAVGTYRVSDLGDSWIILTQNKSVDEFYKREDARAECDRLNARAVIEAMREPTASMIAAALPVASMEVSYDDKRLGAEACLLLSGPINIPDEGSVVIAAAQIAMDYQAMLDAILAELKEPRT